MSLNTIISRVNAKKYPIIIEFANEIVLSDNTGLQAFSRAERETHNSFVHNNRRQSYYLGRYAAKKALRHLFPSIDSSAISIRSGLFGNPIAENCPCSVSIAHSRKTAVAVAFSNDLVIGIDLEYIDLSNCETIQSFLSDREQLTIKNTPFDVATRLTFLWCAKESLGKALRVGLTASKEALSISSLKINNSVIEIEYTNFPTLNTVSWLIEPDLCLSLTKPRNLELETCWLNKRHISNACVNNLDRYNPAMIT